jgi:hypothetical protein
MYNESESLFKDLLDKQKVVIGENSAVYLSTMSSLANSKFFLKKYEEAEVLKKLCLEKRMALLGEQHPHTLRSLNSLAINYQYQGRYVEAETLHKQCLEKKKIGTYPPSLFIHSYSIII